MDSTNPTLTLKHAPIQSGEAIDWLNAKWRRHGEPEDKYSAELIALLTSKLVRCQEALRVVDRFMTGEQSYDGGWTNYPDKPEKSPKDLVREALSE